VANALMAIEFEPNKQNRKGIEQHVKEESLEIK